MNISDNNKINPSTGIEAPETSEFENIFRADSTPSSSNMEEARGLFKQEPRQVAKASAEYNFSDEDRKYILKLNSLGIKLYGMNVSTYVKDSTSDWQGISQQVKTSTGETETRYFDKNTKTFYKALNSNRGESATKPMDIEEIDKFIQTTDVFIRGYRYFIQEKAPGFSTKNLTRLITTLALMKTARGSLSQPASEQPAISEVVEALTKPLEIEGWQSVQDHPPKLIGIFIGISNYINNPEGLRDLRYADSDARGMQDTLLRVGGKMWQEAESNLIVNEPATRENILAVIDRYKGTLGPKDKVVFVYSGHGTNWGDKSYLVPSDTRGGLDNIGDLISDEDILRALAGMSKDPQKPHQGINIIDACSSGGAALKSVAPFYGSWQIKHYDLVKGAAPIKAEGIDKKAETLYPNSVTITATEIDKAGIEVSREGDPGPDRSPGHGVLTMAIINALVGAEGFEPADVDRNGIITAEEVGKAAIPNQAKIYDAHPEVPDWALGGEKPGHPTPQIGDHYQTPPDYPEEEIFTAPGIQGGVEEVQNTQDKFNKVIKDKYIQEQIKKQEQAQPEIKQTPESAPEKPPEKKKPKTIWDWLWPFK